MQFALRGWRLDSRSTLQPKASGLDQRMAAPAARGPASSVSIIAAASASSSSTVAVATTVAVAVAAEPHGTPSSTPSSTSASTSASTSISTAAPSGAAGACPVAWRRLRGVLFDVDGTLVESDPLHFRAFREILAEVGFNGGQPIDEAFFRTHISGRHNPEIAADLFPHWEEAARTDFYMDKEERFRSLARAGLEPLKGLREFLEWARGRGLRMAAVTNAPRANAEMMLSGLGLDSVFEHLVLGEECVRAKPHPDPYLAALELLGLDPDEAVVFEDSPSGVVAGAAAGVPVVALTTGQEPEVLARAGASWVVGDFRDVMAAVRAEADAAADT